MKVTKLGMLRFLPWYLLSGLLEVLSCFLFLLLYQDRSACLQVLAPLRRFWVVI